MSIKVCTMDSSRQALETNGKLHFKLVFYHNMSGHKRTRTFVSRHDCEFVTTRLYHVWAQSCGFKHVWSQTCGVHYISMNLTRQTQPMKSFFFQFS